MGTGDSCCEAAVDELPILGLTQAVPFMLSDQHWASFLARGFLHLGPVLSAGELDDMRFSLDRLAASDGGASLLERLSQTQHEPQYRKELQAVFELMQHPLFHEVCANVWGATGAVGIFRAALLQGAKPGWRQDAAELSMLDRDELVTIRVAIDPDPRGAELEVMPGSHKPGLIAVDGGVLSERELRRHGILAQPARVAVRPGHALLLHRWLVHRDLLDGGRTFDFWFVDGRARSVETGYPHLPILIGEALHEPYPAVRRLEQECATLRKARDTAEEYARSLEACRGRRGARPPRQN